MLAVSIDQPASVPLGHVRLEGLAPLPDTKESKKEKSHPAPANFLLRTTPSPVVTESSRSSGLRSVWLACSAQGERPPASVHRSAFLWWGITFTAVERNSAHCSSLSLSRHFLPLPLPPAAHSHLPLESRRIACRPRNSQ